jgi:phage FluMu gp28-like protein
LVPLPSENCTLNTEHYSNALSSPWNLYFHITMPDAIELGFLDTINAARGTSLKPEQFLADCRSRAGLPEIYEQSYLCNPVSPAASIVDWSAIERCRHEYQIERLHLEHQEILKHFGDATPHQLTRQQKIEDFLHSHFPSLFVPNQSAPKSDAAGSGKRTSDGLRAKGR